MSATTSNAVAPAGTPAPPLSAFDPRLIEVDIVLPDKTITLTGDLAISAMGQKFFSASSSTCTIRIFNLPAAQRQQIITLTSPLKQPRTQVLMNFKVGRKSYGTFLLFSGEVILADVLQPPDIGIVLKSLANNFLTGAISSVQFGATVPLSQIAAGIAASGGWTLKNQATDKNITNFSYTGTPLDGVRELNQMGGVQACVDNNTLIITNSSSAVSGAPFVLNSATGMVGIPQVTEQGVIVKMMLNSQISIGSSVTVQSTTNPAANGTYKVMQIYYEIASRDNPFWYTLYCSNLGIYNGSLG